MRIARFVSPQGMSFGVIDGQGDRSSWTVEAIDGHPFGEINRTGNRWALDDVRLLSPILPSKVVCIGRNYAAHAAELGNEVPKEPMMFLKPSTSVIGPGDAIRLPAASKHVEHEAELAIVIGATGARKVSRDDAHRTIFGITAGNDVSARDLQKSDGQWGRAKGFDSFCPIGPWIETGAPYADIRVACTVDGEVRQDGRTKDLIHDVPTLISYISHVMTLLPGDVIMTGTPEGVGRLEGGNTCTISIEGVGDLTNPVIVDE
ncbi:2-keto-4-pentenoate hydratase/2-oxohepta-3-ene-1,7-dioic acid hydratase in catechol pathway [Antricoccus suffuscus]|uniref:2-keto-4-pentenoate hydratase/2-oxohepta-3-ene-1,7-dioic acid hydratase in catechol pathway n=1 Tax=Antricoccus suffuscus TaxID=1629062 RepID=A0A2T1A559_9ACTN|nr:fumarylacetoacetate hydrolase family protein [Antricoccus suffuscus]PRZ43478.1 2-keto-4-pentenoate hydratase/2-oxohepta-3-ene-1,7-dioic acid hydratase in catechol pathway [Antricoccus suffuscus]